MPFVVIVKRRTNHEDLGPENRLLARTIDWRGGLGNEHIHQRRLQSRI
jgi:hypothetical protein